MKAAHLRPKALPASGDFASRSTRFPLPRAWQAFTRVEGLAAGAGLAVLALISVPTLGGYRSVSDQEHCAANFRQLSRAWLLYAEDNEGRLTGNLDGGEAQDLRSTNRTWAAGWLDFAGSSANTNELFLRNAQLGSYVPSVAVYRCPADESLSRGQTGSPRVRSVAMNSHVGRMSQPYTAGYRIFTTLASIVDPRPADCLLFVDEREDSINDPCFLIDMASFDPSRPTANVWVDYPSGRHAGGATMSFVDGHVETWRWMDARTVPVPRPGALLTLGQPSPNNPDVTRVQRAASRRNVP